MLLESRADHEFAQRLNHNLRELTEEIRKMNELMSASDIDKLHKLASNLASADVDEKTSDAMNRVIADSQNLMESIEMLRKEERNHGL